MIKTGKTPQEAYRNYFLEMRKQTKLLYPMFRKTDE